MAVYVDPAVFLKVNGRKKYCHMIADTLEELHTFAEKIGVKKHFFHKSATYLHYDLNDSQRTIAVENGALEISSKELVIKSKELKL